MEDSLVNAVDQLREVAEVLGMRASELKRLEAHDRVVEKDLEVTMDDGTKKSFKAYRAQHNNLLGPYKGGLRFHPLVTREEVMALSMWMTWKTAVVGLLFGGGKGGVAIDVKELSEIELERVARAYVRAFVEVIGPETDVPAPDVNTNPKVIGWMVDEYIKFKAQNSKVKIKEPAAHLEKGKLLAAFTGKPVEVGGCEGREQATGRGGFYVLQALAERLGMAPSEMRVVVQGVGNVGYWLAKLACEAGFSVVGMADSGGGVVMKDGDGSLSKGSCLMFDELIKCKSETGSIVGCRGLEKISSEELLGLPVEVVVPAALENVITEVNADKIQAKVVLEMANGPVTPKADRVLREKGVVVVPDILANSGGVCVSYFEWLQNIENEHWSEGVVDVRLEEKMKRAFGEVWEEYEKMGTGKASMRQAAYVVGVGRVLEKLRAGLA